MALRFRVRRATFAGPVQECTVDRLAKAVRVARQALRETGRAVWIERKVDHGWETAMELFPAVANPVERELARGARPRVQDAAGRPGRVLSFLTHTRECWVEWGGSGQREKVPVDALRLR